MTRRAHTYPATARTISIQGEIVACPRPSLRVYEAAFVARRPEKDIRNMLRRGALTTVPAGRNRCVDPQELADLIADDPLASEILRGILDGRVEALRAVHPSLDPPSLVWAIHAL